MNGHDRTSAIVFTAQHLLDLGGLHFLIERFECLREFGVDRLSRFRPFEQHREVFALFLERQAQIAILLEPATALEDFLCFSLVFPEIGRGGAGLEAGQLLVGSSGLKDSPEDRGPCG
jgi:hypothetical protein